MAMAKSTFSKMIIFLFLTLLALIQVLIHTFILNCTEDHCIFFRMINTQDFPQFPGYDAFHYGFSKKKPTTYSTSHDLCMTPILGSREGNFVVNLFSIRKSGCAATIIIFTNNISIFSKEAKQLITLFEVKIVKGIIKNNNLLRHFDFVRDEMCFYFLKHMVENMNKNEAMHVDRVFFFDSFDVYFEKDPFNYFDKKDMVYFFQESNIKLYHDKFNSDGVRKCFGYSALSLIREKTIICSGTMAAGSATAFLRFLDFFIHSSFYTDQKCPYDQGALIYIIHSGILSSNNISFHVFPPDGPVGACKIGPIVYQKRLYMGNNYIELKSRNNNHVFEVVHQYSHFPYLRNEFTRKTFFKQYIIDKKLNKKLNHTIIDEIFTIILD